MTKNPRIAPDKTLSATDPGDETQRRYRYQAVYAAIICLDLLDEESEFEDIFCEQHEDTLVKKKDGTFIGIQVKTRAPGRELFKSNDESVMKSLKRFVELSVEYPNQFSRFVLATNYAFWSERKNSSNLRYILNLAKEAVETSSPQLTRSLSGYIKKLSKKMGPNVSVTSDMILNVLYQVELQDDLPKFDDVESRLAIHHIPSFYDVGEAGYDDLLRAAKALINKMFEAGALQHVSAKQMYFALCSNPAQARTDAIIDGKRITKQTVEEVLTESLFANTLLSTKNKIEVADLPPGITTLALKMAAGKVSARNIRRIIDFKYSVEKLLNSWIYKYSPKKANRYYEQLSLIVGNECEEAYDLVQTENNPFGQEMLNKVRQRLRRRLVNDPHLFFGCEYEHLLGIIAILTEQCEVWWSEEFTIPGDTQ